MSTASATGAPTSGGQRDLANLLTLCDAHKRIHDDPSLSASETQNHCRSTLSKLKKFLPRLQRVRLSPSSSCADMKGFCDFLELLLSREVCEHCPSIFNPQILGENVERLFMLLQLMSMPKFQEVRESLLRVTCSLLTMVQAHHPMAAYLTMFEDLVTLVDDTLLLLRLLLNNAKPGAPHILTPNTKLKFFCRTTANLTAASQNEEERTAIATTTQNPPAPPTLQGPPTLDIPAPHNLLLVLISISEAIIKMLSTTSHFLAASPSFLSLAFHFCEQLELSVHLGFQYYTTSLPGPILTQLQDVAVEALSTIMSRLNDPPSHVKLRVLSAVLHFSRLQINHLAPFKVPCLIEALKVMLRAIAFGRPSATTDLLMMATPEVMKTLAVCTKQDPDSPGPTIQDGQWSRLHLSILRHVTGWVLRRMLRECPQAVRHLEQLDPQHLEWDLADWLFPAELMMCWKEVAVREAETMKEAVLLWASGRTDIGKTPLKPNTRKRPRPPLSQPSPSSKKRSPGGEEAKSFEDFIFGNEGKTAMAVDGDDEDGGEEREGMGAEEAKSHTGGEKASAEIIMKLKGSEHIVWHAALNILRRCDEGHGELKRLLQDVGSAKEEDWMEKVVLSTFRVVHGVQLAVYTLLGQATEPRHMEHINQWEPLLSKLVSLSDIFPLFSVNSGDLFIKTAIPHLLLNLSLTLGTPLSLDVRNTAFTSPTVSAKVKELCMILSQMGRSCLECLGHPSQLAAAVAEAQCHPGRDLENLTTACHLACPEDGNHAFAAVAQAQLLPLLDKVFVVAACLGTLEGDGTAALNIRELRCDDSVRSCLDATMIAPSPSVVRDAIPRVPIFEAFVHVLLSKGADGMVKKAALRAWPVLLESLCHDGGEVDLSNFFLASMSAGNWYLRRDAKEVPCHAYLATWLRSLVRIAVFSWSPEFQASTMAASTPRVRVQPVLMAPLRAYSAKTRKDPSMLNGPPTWKKKALADLLYLLKGYYPLAAARRTTESRIISLDAMLTLLCATPLESLREQGDHISNLMVNIQHMLQDDVPEVREEVAIRISAFLWDDAKLMAILTGKDHLMDRAYGLVSYLDECLEQRHRDEQDLEAVIRQALKLGTVIKSLGIMASEISSKRLDQVYLWAVVKLVEIWTAKATYSPMAYEELIRISRNGYLSLESMLTEVPRETMPKIIRSLLVHDMVEDFVDYIMPEMKDHFNFLHLAGGYVLTQMVLEKDLEGINKYMDTAVRLQKENYRDRAKLLTDYSTKVLPRVMMEDHLALEFWLGVLGGITLGQAVQQGEQSMCAETLWEMAVAQGTIDSRFMRAKDTLKALANIAANARAGVYEDDGYSTGTQLELDSPNRADLVGTFVAEHFLFTVSNYVMPVDWRAKSLDRKLASLRCLQLMMETVRPEALANFAPKIVVLMNICLTEDKPEVLSLCCRVMSVFVRRLPDTCLEEHLTIIVVAMLPIIENPQSAPEDRTTMINLLEYLFLDKEETLKESFWRVPFIPDLPELERVHEVINDYDTGSNLQKLKRLIQLLSHDSSGVRLATLRKLLHILRSSRQILYSLISGSDMAEDAISDLITALLRMCPDETDSETKMAICTCLGEIGAVDPARLNVTLCSRIGKGQQALQNPTSPALVAPWAVTESELSMTIIEHMLVPALRAAAQDHDRIPFAIQSLLGLVGMRGPRFFHIKDSDNSGGNSSDDDEMENEEEQAFRRLWRDDVIPEPRERGPLPRWFRKVLVNRGVFSAVEPLWASCYMVKKQVPPRGPPFFRPRIPLDRCLNNFCRYFIMRSQGPFRLLFESIQGIVRISGSLLLFIFPYLVADAWCFGDMNDRNVLLSEIKSVISWSGGKKGDDEANRFTEVDHMATQAVLGVLDTIREWSHVKEKAPPGSSQWRSQVDGDGSSGASPTPTPGVWEACRDRMRTLMEALPTLTLVQASLRIHGYTRALKYLELIIQRPPLRQTISSSPPATGDSAPVDSITPEAASSPLEIMALPVLEPYEVELLQRIFSQLDEPDSMGGVAAARRWAGLPTTLRQRIREYEHAEEWAYALQGYEQLLQEGDVRLKTGTNLDEDDEEFLQVPEHEREGGLLRSLVELDHLQSAINQFLGMVSQHPDMTNDLAPLGIEACWRLQQWPLLKDLLKSQDSVGKKEADHTASLTFSSLDKRYPVLLGQAIQALHERDKKAFDRCLASTREEVMIAVSAASMESYQRCYAPLIRLHVLNELEQGYSLLDDAGKALDPAAVRSLLDKWAWDARLSVMTTSVRLRAPVMAVRRTIFQMAQQHVLTAQSWVIQAVNAVSSGRFQLADAALRHAATLGMDSNTLAIHEAELLHAQGNTQKALLLLEPVSIDLNALRAKIANIIRTAPPAESEEHRISTAERLLLTTNWMIEARLKHGQAVLDRFQLALELRPKWEEGHFALGKYFDFLAEARKKEAQSGGGAKDDGGTKKLADDELLRNYVANTLEQYAMSLQHGAKNIFQSMPRLLTLWFEVGQFMADIPAPKASSVSRASSRHGSSGSQNLTDFFTRCNAAVKKAIQQVPAFMWYTSLPQLLSRVGHCKGDLQALVVEAVAKVLSTHPEQAMWSVTGLCYSKDPERKRMGERIMHLARNTLNTEKNTSSSDMLTDSKKLFADLITVATSNEEPAPSSSERRIRVSIGNRLFLTRFLVPIQAALVVSLPNTRGSSRGSYGSFNGSRSIMTQGYEFDFDQLGQGYMFYDAFPNSQMQIQKFDDYAQVLYSKAKPKKVSITTTCGRNLIFLCKEERQGDQRKDARVMEFNGVINRLLQRDPEGRRRKLRLRTYAVVCLNEECGLMEWVPNTQCFRGCVNESIKPRQFKKMPPFRDIRTTLETLQATYAQDLPTMAREFRDQILTKMPPTLRMWFFERYPEPTAWFESRTTFTRSAAVWSAVGHVIGLGDRHGENILVDTKSGELVHVDFDCLFDKGLTLNRPEVVPFRLTPNMLDGMGVTGHEGVYRSVMEHTLRVLRDHRDTLLSVLDPFLSDPTVSWDHLSRLSQQYSSSSPAHGTLVMIDERLRGIYNLRVPEPRSSSSKKKSSSSSRSSTPSTDLIALPLSVEGQVQKLIHEATSVQNLAIMYVGWQPWC